MQYLVTLYNDIIFNLQQLIYQPASRRSVVASVGAGFTIVELLIVIVVIGILAAIVIVAFNGIQNQAYDTTVKGDLSNAAKMIELHRTESTSGLYPTSTSQLDAIQTAGKYSIRVSSGSYLESGNNFLFCYGTGGSTYAIVARSKSNQTFYISNNSGGPVVYTGSYTGQATVCPAVGQGTSGYWGRNASGVWSAWVSA